jgi:hypothetical protein
MTTNVTTLETIGICAQKNYHFWLEAVRDCMPKQIVSVSFYEDVQQSHVDVWLVVPDKTINPIHYAFWLHSLRAPIVVVTPHTEPARRVTSALSYLSMICHPLQAQHDLHSLLYLASRRTGGICVVNAPPEWRAGLRGAW